MTLISRSMLALLLLSSAVTLNHAAEAGPEQEPMQQKLIRKTDKAPGKVLEIVEADATVTPATTKRQSVIGLHEAMSVSPSGLTEMVGVAEENGSTGQSLENLLHSLFHSEPGTSLNNSDRLDVLKKMAEQDEADGQGHPERVSSMQSIKSLVEGELIPDIKQNREAKVAEINEFHDAIKKVISESSVFYGSLKTEGDSETMAARTSHEQCRTSEAAVLATQKEKCDAMKNYLDTVVSSNTVPGTYCGKMPSSSDANAVKKYTDSMHEYFNTVKPMVDKLVEDCNAATEAAKTAKADCDTKQGQFESHFCQWKSSVQKNCATFDRGYNDSVKALEVVVHGAKERVEGWKAEYAAAKTIVCYCNVWISDKSGGKYKEGSFKHCSTNSTDTNLLNIDPPSVPSNAMCDADRAAIYPGDAKFKSKEYSKFLSRAAVATTTCPSASCSTYSCQTAGWVMKKGVEGKTEPNEAACCEATCSSYSCQTSGWIKTKGVEKQTNPNEEACCEVEIKPLVIDLGYKSGTDFTSSLAHWGVPSRTWTTCYDSTVDGKSNQKFHSKCDGSATVWVAKLSTGKTIGGYTPHSWSGGNYHQGYSAFLFSLTTNHKYSLYQYQYYATYSNSGYGPTYGGGHDFQCSLDTMTGYCNLGHTYACRTGSYGSSSCRDDFCGSYSSWTIEKFQVFK